MLPETIGLADPSNSSPDKFGKGGGALAVRTDVVTTNRLKTYDSGMTYESYDEGGETCGISTCLN